jgi:hypothetical protein
MRVRPLFVMAIVLACVILAATANVLGQNHFRVVGRVTSSGGAGLPNVEVVVLVDRVAQKSVPTGPDGRYVVAIPLPRSATVQILFRRASYRTGLAQYVGSGENTLNIVMLRPDEAPDRLSAAVDAAINDTYRTLPFR